MGLFLYVLPAHFCENISGLFLVLLFSAIVYFSSLYLFKGITKEEISGLLKK
jgi:hypothetical protein